MVLHVKKVNNNIIIPEKEFQIILKILEKNQPIEIDDNFDDLVSASSSSMDFWLNSEDDEAWNNA